MSFLFLMFLLRGIPFVDLAYLHKNDLRDNVITYRRRKTGRPLSVMLTPEAMILIEKYMNRDPSSPYLFSFLKVVKEQRKPIMNISWHCAALTND